MQFKWGLGVGRWLPGAVLTGGPEFGSPAPHKSLERQSVFVTSARVWMEAGGSHNLDGRLCVCMCGCTCMCVGQRTTFRNWFLISHLAETESFLFPLYAHSHLAGLWASSQFLSFTSISRWEGCDYRCVAHIWIFIWVPRMFCDGIQVFLGCVTNAYTQWTISLAPK